MNHLFKDFPPSEDFFQLFPEGAIFLDLETTGLSPVNDFMVELGALKITRKGTTQLESLVRPPVPIPQNTIAIHGITDAMVMNAPQTREVLLMFIDFCENLPIIAHNASFDAGFLICGFHRENLTPPSSAVYDSCRLARRFFAQVAQQNKPENFKLSTLANFFQISLHQHHRAASDALTCLAIVLKLIALNPHENQRNNYKEKSFLFHLKNFANTHPLEIPTYLKGLIPYVESQTPIEILYQGGSHKGIFRPIEPLSLLPLPQGLILQAICLLDRELKTFTLKKIKDFRPSNLRNLADS